MRRSVVGAILLATWIGVGCGDDAAVKDARDGDSPGGDGQSSGGDGDGDSPGGDGDGDSPGGDGDGDGRGDGDGDGPRPSGNGRDVTGQCLNTDTDSACTDEELDAYSSCMSTQCGASYEACFGAGYARGEYAGPCRDWISCTQGCDCDDLVCFLTCGEPPDACAECLLAASTCVEEKCPAPACLSEHAGGGGEDPGSPRCEQLGACCASMEDEDFKAACQLTYEQAKLTGDAACGPLYDGFVQQRLCE